MRHFLLFPLFLGCASGKQAGVQPTPMVTPLAEVDAGPATANISIPVNEDIATLARSIMTARFAVYPSQAAEAGLMLDAVRVPSFEAKSIAPLVKQLEADGLALRALHWANLSTAEQTDVRWLVAQADTLRHVLETEKRWVHKPTEWLETVANTLIAFATYAPDDLELQLQLTELLPGMVDEMKRLCVEPTRRDVDTARDVLSGLIQMLEALPANARRDAGLSSLNDYDTYLEGLSDLPEFRVIGEEAYEWRLKNQLMLPWDADGLLAVAQSELDRVDARLAELEPTLSPTPDATPEQIEAAENFTRDDLLSLYEDMVEEDLAALRTMNVIDIPHDLVAIKARETPKSLIPLTGDGGSMNPPPLFGEQSVGWWNVENFNPEWTQEEKLGLITNAAHHKSTWFGPYAVHEGVPGHHLQLALMRANPNPIRTVLWDNPTVEGWGLYAEELFQENGGFGDSPDGEAAMLRSYRFRIRRVMYDVNVETGRWTLAQAAEFKNGDPEAVDRDILRAIHWPTQLIGYFAGKHQIMELKGELKSTQGEAFSEVTFHSELLQEGLIPMALIRAKMLGKPIPHP
jgi:uncharacterized protein (DUF885 family)